MIPNIDLFIIYKILQFPLTITFLSLDENFWLLLCPLFLSTFQTKYIYFLIDFLPFSLLILPNYVQINEMENFLWSIKIANSCFFSHAEYFRFIIYLNGNLKLTSEQFLTAKNIAICMHMLNIYKHHVDEINVNQWQAVIVAHHKHNY